MDIYVSSEFSTVHDFYMNKILEHYSFVVPDWLDSSLHPVCYVYTIIKYFILHIRYRYWTQIIHARSTASTFCNLASAYC